MELTIVYLSATILLYSIILFFVCYYYNNKIKSLEDNYEFYVQQNKMLNEEILKNKINKLKNEIKLKNNLEKKISDNLNFKIEKLNNLIMELDIIMEQHKK